METRRTFAEALERAFVRSKAARAFYAVNAGAGALALVATPMVQGCGSESGNADETAPADETDPVLQEGKGDWAQSEGQRRPDMVTYNTSWNAESTDCGGRGGCMTQNIVVQMLVQRVDGANLDQKRVGIVYHEPGRATQTTVLANYRGEDSNTGKEIWEANVALRKWDHPGAFAFTTWYQDGKGSTYYDDNTGEYFVHAWLGTYAVIHAAYGNDSPAVVNDAGLSGKIRIEVLDLDYDKDIVMVCTVDGWTNVMTFPIGNEYVNNWHWISNGYNGSQLWEIPLDYKGNIEQFEYAIVYRHGGKNGSKVFEFWDNNGGHNYVIRKNQYVSRF